MKLLPSEQTKELERVPEIMGRVEQGKKIILEEPCDCGSMIRHNNGGNYHDITYLTKDAGKYFIRDDSTSELEPPAEWEETTRDEVEKRISEALSQGWYIQMPQSVPTSEPQ